MQRNKKYEETKRFIQGGFTSVTTLFSVYLARMFPLSYGKRFLVNCFERNMINKKSFEPQNRPSIANRIKSENIRLKFVVCKEKE